MEAKREGITLKKEQQMKNKLQAKLLKKAMKNPNMHPGFTFPGSKKIEDIVEVRSLL